MITFIGVIFLLFVLSTLVDILFYNKATDCAYFHIKKVKFGFPAYSGISFERISKRICFLNIQFGKDGYDKCITICNISIIIGGH